MSSASLPRLPVTASARSRVLIVDDNVELVGTLHAVIMSAELAAKIGDTKITEKLIAMTVDCNGGYVYLDPYEGGKAAVTEA